MSSTPEEDDAEVEAWRDVDPADPESVARALAALGMRAGAKLATIEHMHERIGRSLTAFNEATATLRELVPRTEMEEQLRQLRKDVDEDRQKDRQRSGRRFIGLVVVGLLFATIVATGWALNAAAIRRAENQQLRSDSHSDVVAICASTYPGDEVKIRACTAARDLPSGP